MEVVFVPPVLTEPKSAVVEEASFIKDDAWFVRFEGVDTKDTADQLVGRYCLVRKADLPEGWEDLANGGLAGYEVIDEELGALGTVDRLVEMPAQALLAVVPPDGAGEVLIPIVDEFIREVDEEARVIRVAVPASLVELGREG